MALRSASEVGASPGPRRRAPELMAALAVLLAVGCRTFEPVDVLVVQRPAAADSLARVRRLAVVGFDETGVPGIDSFLAAEVERRLQAHFPLVARSRVRQVLQERDLWRAVFTDSPAQREAGRILKASHLLIGTVVRYDCTDRRSEVLVPSVETEGYDVAFGVLIPRDAVRTRRAERVVRVAEVKLAARIVAVDTSENVLSATGSASEQSAPSVNGQPPLPDGEALLEAATERALARLLGQMVPVRLRQAVTLAVRGELRQGADYLRAGDLERALAAFEQQTLGPLEPYAWYDVGVVHELQQRPKQAAQAYGRALAIMPSEPRFQKALARVRAARQLSEGR